ARCLEAEGDCMTYAEWLVDLSKSNSDLTMDERAQLCIVADSLDAKDKRIAELEEQLEDALAAIDAYREPAASAAENLVAAPSNEGSGSATGAAGRIADAELGVVCTHGQLERVCEVCELTVERDALAARVAACTTHFHACDCREAEFAKAAAERDAL